MIRVFHKRYEEDFRGEKTVRDESPHVTYNWLDRRVELSQRDVRTAQARLDEARHRDASTREIERLADEVKDMRERHAHASEAKRLFTEAWKPGHGYTDESLWESRVKAREAEDRRQAREAAEIKAVKDRGAPVQPAAPRDEPPAGKPAAEKCKAARQGLSDSGSELQSEMEASEPTSQQSSQAQDPAGDPERSDAPTSPGVPSSEYVARRSYKGLKNTPPEEHKFKKGAPSPNPKGRPKGARNLGTVIRELAGQTIKVNQKGRRKSVNVIAAATQLQINKALQGDTKAFGLVMPLLREFWNEEIETKDTELSADERALLNSLKRARKLLDDGDDDGGGKA